MSGARGSECPIGGSECITIQSERNALADLMRRNVVEELSFMARGGARNRSGPQKVEGSRTSERQGFSLTALPPAGYDAEPPDFPLPLASERELTFWSQVWATPQACAWSLEPWRWPVVAMYVRTFVQAEDAAAPNAALLGQIHRFGDQIGLTPAGLKENGWKIADPEAAPVGASLDVADDEDDPRNRLSVVRDGTGG